MIRLRTLFLSAAVLLCCYAQPLTAQHLENSATGTVRNTGTITFRDDDGQFKNDAAYINISNNVIEFAGSDNSFTDLAGNPDGPTSLGHIPAWRVPGMVRYALSRDVQQLVQQRWYTNLEMADSSQKWIPDSVFVGGEYTIFLSGPRTYNGTFFYDGTARQYIMQERGLSGTVDRYNNMTLLHGPKDVRSGMEVRMEGIFINDTVSPLFTEGEFYWGTDSYVNAPVTVWAGGYQVSGSGVSELRADVEVQNGEFNIKDDADTVTIFPTYQLRAVNDVNALFTMGDNTHLLVLGDYRNAYGPLTNATFSGSSLVNYDGLQDPQIMQATAASKPYGNLRTARTIKNSNGNVFVASDLEVNDTNVVMMPNTMSLTLGAATYTNNAEVEGAFRRNLAGAALGDRFVYNNEETWSEFSIMPQDFTMDVRPITRPNDYDPTTDVFRKITVTHTGPYKATVRTGYKATDIPPTWVPTTAERLLKMYNAYPVPNERSIKLTPTVPPTYARRPLAQSTGIGYVELSGIEDSGADNLRLDFGNDILLRGSRDILKAVASGRWSNPFTWDEAREPEPEDRVIVDGFTVHVGYVRANDNYAIEEEYPDSMALSVLLTNTVNTTLLFGYEGTFDTFSLVPDGTVLFTQDRVVPDPALIDPTTRDVTAANLDGGLVVYRRSTFITPNLLISLDATVINDGTLQIGVP